MRNHGYADGLHLVERGRGVTHAVRRAAGGVVLATLLTLGGCNDDSPPSGAGGSGGTAGHPVGGAAGVSGKSGGRGGSSGSTAGADEGGSDAGGGDNGGVTGRGGTAGSGGRAAGGSAGEGATENVGGEGATDGTSAKGGTNATGGTSAAGGTNATGGSDAGVGGDGTAGTETGGGGDTGGEDLDLCATNNGGCDPVAECTNGHGTRWCVCPAGYRGDGMTCTLIDSCPCENGGKCVEYKGNVVCDCVPGTSGPTCNLRTTTLVSGSNLSCSIMTDDNVRCWGAQQTPDMSSTPAFVELAAGSSLRSCGLTAAGQVYCWHDDWPPALAAYGPVTSMRMSEDTLCTQQPDGHVGCDKIGSPNDIRPPGSGGDTTWIVHGDGWTSSWGERPGPTHPVKAFARGRAVGALSHSCNIEPDGTLTCEGNNDAGQASPPAGTFSALALGRGHSCALTTGGIAKCWGDNTYGQSTPPSGVFQSISAGDDHNCGVRPTLYLECWGRNDSGQTSVDTINTYFSVSAGGAHTCGLRTDKTAQCWGNNDYGQTNAPPPINTVQKFTEVVAGGRHSCGIDGGILRCWGDNSRGQAPGSASSYGWVSVGREHTCAVDPTYTVVCWGNGDSGQTTPQFEPMVYQSYAVGSEFCGVLTSGKIRCASYNRYPALGSTVYPPPTGVYKSVAVGNDQACAISADDTVRCWGAEGGPTPPGGSFTSLWMASNYACGLRPGGTPECWSVPGVDSWPTLEPPAEPFTTLSAGYDFVCGLRADGTVRCWGNDHAPGATPPAGVFRAVTFSLDDYCGIRSSGSVYCTDSSRVHLSAPPGPFVEVSLGRHACGRRPDGSLECWGDSSTPPPRGTFQTVSVGNPNGTTADCAIRDDGTLACWGGASPDAPPDGNFVGVSMGYRQGVAVGTDHQAVCWGSTQFGQSCATPPSDAFLRVDAANEGDDVCGLRTDGTLQCWGSDSNGTSLWTNVPTGTFSAVSVSPAGGNACALLPDGTPQCFTHQGYPDFALPGPFDTIDTGGYYHVSACGVRPDGRLECWGDIHR